PFRIKATLQQFQGLRKVWAPEAAILGAGFSPQGSLLFVRDEKGVVQIWDAEEGRQVGNDLKHPRVVLNANFSPDGKLLVTATAGKDGKVRLWDGDKGEPIGRPLDHGSNVNWAAFRFDGAVLATASDDRSIRFWDPGKGEEYRGKMRVPRRPRYVEYSPNGKY